MLGEEIMIMIKKVRGKKKKLLYSATNENDSKDFLCSECKDAMFWQSWLCPKFFRHIQKKRKRNRLKGKRGIGFES